MHHTDTHTTEAELSSIKADQFDIAVLADELGNGPVYVYSCPFAGRPYVRRDTWRRLVIHVPDAKAPGTIDRMLAALGVELLDVPF